MKSELKACALFILLSLTNMYCSDNKPSDNPPIDTPEKSTPDTPQTPPDTSITRTPSRIELLKHDLTMVQTEILMEEHTHINFVGDAKRAMMRATSQTASAEEKELAQERADISLKGAKESEAKLDQLKVKRDSIQTEISTLSSQ